MIPRMILAATVLVFAGTAQSVRPSPVVSAVPADPVRRPAERKPSAFATRAHAKPAPARAALIRAGTSIRVRLAQTLDTRHTQPGATFAATLDDPIVAGDHVVVPKGTPFRGIVVASKRSGRFRGRAMIQIALRSFRLNGRDYRIATVPDTRVSGSHKKRNLALMGGGPATGASIGAIAGGGAGALIGAGVGAAAGGTAAFFTGRKNVTLPVETSMAFSLRYNVYN